MQWVSVWDGFSREGDAPLFVCLGGRHNVTKGRDGDHGDI